MRTALFQYLTQNCQTVKTWKQPYTADASTPKPYGVIKFDGRPRNSGNRRTSFQDLRVWIYVDPGSFLPLDAAAREICALLSDHVLTTQDGRRFLIEWVYEGSDFYDDELKANCRFIDFRIPLGG